MLQKTLAALAGTFLLGAHLAWAEPEVPINVNTATAEELTALDGVGAARAEAIVEYREQIGEFANFDELRAVPGVGDYVINTNKEWIIFSN